MAEQVAHFVIIKEIFVRVHATFEKPSSREVAITYDQFELFHFLSIQGFELAQIALTSNFGNFTTLGTMADSTKKWSDNAAGKYYVDDQCIDCDACRAEAPDNYRRNEDHGYSYVYKQASNAEEETRCKAAMEACPVEAIGNDG